MPVDPNTVMVLIFVVFNNISIIASWAYVLHIFIFFQMGAHVVIPEWRRCLCITTPQQKIMSRTASNVHEPRVSSSNRRRTGGVYRL